MLQCRPEQSQAINSQLARKAAVNRFKATQFTNNITLLMQCYVSAKAALSVFQCKDAVHKPKTSNLLSKPTSQRHARNVSNGLLTIITVYTVKSVIDFHKLVHQLLYCNLAPIQCLVWYEKFNLYCISSTIFFISCQSRYVLGNRIDWSDSNWLDRQSTNQVKKYNSFLGAWPILVP